MSKQFAPYMTDDGSYTFFSEEFGQTFHSKYGAKEESLFKYAIPTLLAEKACRGHLRILDICYGLGYNSAAALSTIWRSNPDCTVEIMALELDRTVAIAAIDHNLLGDWEEPIPQLLTQLVRSEIIDRDRLKAKLTIGDARQTIGQVIEGGFKADAIFLDPFSPPAMIHSKYALLKNAEELNDLQKDKLKEIGEILPELAAMHKMKESFRDIFESRIDWSEALFKLCDWIVESEQKFPKSCGTIKRWIGEIVSYFDNRTTQGVVEGINNKLKLIKRRGYGFRNFDNFQIRSMLSWHFSN